MRPVIIRRTRKRRHADFLFLAQISFDDETGVPVIRGYFKELIEDHIKGFFFLGMFVAGITMGSSVPQEFVLFLNVLVGARCLFVYANSRDEEKDG